MRFLALPLFLLALLLPASPLHADGHDETTDARVDRLEKEVALLQAQLKALQAEVQALRAQVAGTQPTEKPDTPARDDVLVGSWRIDIPATMARMKAAGASQAKIDGVQEMGAVMTLIIDLDEDGTFYVGMSTNGQVRETAAGTWTRDGQRVTLFSKQEDGREREKAREIAGMLEAGQLILREREDDPGETMVFVPTSEKAPRANTPDGKREAHGHEGDAHDHDAHEHAHDKADGEKAPAEKVEEAPIEKKAVEKKGDRTPAVGTSATSLVGTWQLDVEKTRVSMKAFAAKLLGDMEGPQREVMEARILEGVAQMELTVVFAKDGSWTGLMKGPGEEEGEPARGTWTQKGNAVTIVTTHENGKERESPETMEARLEKGRLLVTPGETPDAPTLYLMPKK